MMHVFIGIPAYKIIIDSLAADITDFVAFYRPELLRLICTVVLNWIVRTIIGVKINRILILPPLCIERYIVCRHFSETIRGTGTKRVVIPSKENISVKSGFNIVICSVDVSLVVDILLCLEIGTCCRCVLNRVTTTVYKDAITIGNIILIT